MRAQSYSVWKPEHPVLRPSLQNEVARRVATPGQREDRRTSFCRRERVAPPTGPPTKSGFSSSPPCPMPLWKSRCLRESSARSCDPRHEPPTETSWHFTIIFRRLWLPVIRKYHTTESA